MLIIQRLIIIILIKLIWILHAETSCPEYRHYVLKCRNGHVHSHRQKETFIHVCTRNVHTCSNSMQLSYTKLRITAGQQTILINCVVCPNTSVKFCAATCCCNLGVAICSYNNNAGDMDVCTSDPTSLKVILYKKMKTQHNLATSKRQMCMGAKPPQ